MHALVVPLLADLPAILDTSPGNASWVVTTTLLSTAVFSPINGRLGDMYGKKKMLLICIIPLVLGSAVCAMASSLLPMLVGRALQGMGTGIIPLGISAMRDVVPKERRRWPNRPVGGYFSGAPQVPTLLWSCLFGGLSP